MSQPSVTETNKSRLPGLDGLRGVSILLVIMCHSGWTHLFPKRLGDALSRISFPVGMFGVPIFFVISGFLITYLLLREEERQGRVNLKKFWVRRFLRIVPPVLAYVGFVLAYASLKGIKLAPHDLAAVLLFFRNMVSGNTMLDHFWSLSIEEQFYAIWPLVFIFLPRTRRFWIALITLLGFSVLRVTGAMMLNHEGFVLLARLLRFDCILVGCLLALSYDIWARISFTVAQVRNLRALGIFLVFLSLATSVNWSVFPLASGTSVGSQLIVEFVTATGNAGIALIMVTLLVDAAENPMMNWKWLRSIGLISYSLYLWQQFFFFAPSLPSWMGFLPVRIVFAFGAGACGYFFIERPLNRLRQRIGPLQPVYIAKKVLGGPVVNQ
jgi:peptidoglycan/LPS O-acetylase OafA/YrhL